VKRIRELLVTANAVSNSLILFTLIMEEVRSSETSALTKTTRPHIPEDGILLMIFNGPNPSGRNTALDSPQPLTEMSIRDVPGRKGRPVGE
jgi:hypothetical protein